MTVTFYKTKLNSCNRCYDVAAYERYLGGCTRSTFDLSHDIVQDNPFQVPSTENALDWYEYNYITWEVNGRKYGAFIDDVRYNAITGTTTVYHKLDVWYFVLNNCVFDMHGQAIRAHVNDMKRADVGFRGTLENTYNTPEEQFNAENVIRDKRSLFSRSDDCRWVYIYFNNPQGDPLNAKSFYQNVVAPTGDKIALTGAVVVGALYVPTGTCCFRPKSATEEGHNGVINLANLTGDMITSMVISDIPPTPDATMEALVGIPTFDIGGTITKFVASSETITGYPNYMVAPATLYMRVQRKFSELKTADGYKNLIYEDTVLGFVGTYEAYLGQIVKARSTVYNPIFIQGNYVSSMKTSSESAIQYGLSPDFTFNYTVVQQSNLQGLAPLSVKNNVSAFAPDTVLDYWTQQNAMRTSLAAKQQKFNSIMQGIKASVDFTLDVVRGAGQAATGGALMTASGGAKGFGSLMGGVTTLANAPLDLATATGNATFNYQMADITEQIAQRQYQNGQVSSEVAVSYYINLTQGDACEVEIIYQNETNLRHIAERLHRYGYATFLQLDEIYTHHRRTKFNFIQTLNAEITGVPTRFAEELAQMFNGGVHLWSGNVEEWEVVNYQENLFD